MSKDRSEYYKQWQQTESGKARRERAKEKAKERFPNGRVTCAECGISYDAIIAADRGYKKLGKFKVICC